MEQNRNEDVASFEKISDNYLNDLQAKLQDLQDEAWEDKVTIAELEEFLCSLQGKAAVFYQRAEELGVANFKEMMEQAEEELERAKDESEALSCEELNESNNMLLDVEAQAQKLELLRTQFKDNTELEDFKQRSERLNELKNEVLETEKEIADVEASGEDLMVEMQSFVEHDLALEYFQHEQEQLNGGITDISFKLHHRRSETPLP